MLSAAEGAAAEKKYAPMVKMDDAKFNDWLSRWQKNIIGDARNRYCDKAMGEDIGWLMTPFMDGFYYGYMATKDPKWVDMLVDWTDSWVKRAVKEPDGCLGWPKLEAAGTKVDNLDDFNADSMLGEAMVLPPGGAAWPHEILKTPALKEKYGAKAESYLKLSEQIYEKWDRARRLARNQGRRDASAWCCPSGSTARAASGRQATPRGTPPATASRTRTTRPISSPAGCWPCPTPPASRSTRSGPRSGSS